MDNQLGYIPMAELPPPQKAKTLSGVKIEDADLAGLIADDAPVILKGAMADNPFVKAGMDSPERVLEHLLDFYNDRPMLYYRADAAARGRFFYKADMSGLNFRTDHAHIAEFFALLDKAHTQSTGEAYYIGSARVSDYFPEYVAQSGLNIKNPQFEACPPRVGLWMGNQTTAATHFDTSHNLALCCAGRRRFTLFPPSQIANLYPGPLEPTPGGQVVSLVDLKQPDFEKFPKFRTALEHAQIADLEPGDVLVYPALWWHQVDALEPFNILVNYWWNEVPAHLDSPMVTLLHGLMSVKGRSGTEKQAWRHLFDYYVFGDEAQTRDHIASHLQGALAPLDEKSARQLRAKILRKLNR